MDDAGPAFQRVRLEEAFIGEDQPTLELHQVRTGGAVCICYVMKEAALSL
jgi:hypothetical protein